MYKSETERINELYDQETEFINATYDEETRFKELSYELEEAAEIDGELRINWDYVGAAFAPGVIDAMFAGFRAAIESAGSAPK